MLTLQIRCIRINEAAVCASSDGLPCPAAICAAALLRCHALAQPTSHPPARLLSLPAAQALLCKRMGKKRIIAETGAGQHGVATVRTWGRGWLGGPSCGASWRGQLACIWRWRVLQGTAGWQAGRQAWPGLVGCAASC